MIFYMLDESSARTSTVLTGSSCAIF